MQLCKDLVPFNFLMPSSNAAYIQFNFEMTYIVYFTDSMCSMFVCVISPCVFVQIIFTGVLLQCELELKAKCTNFVVKRSMLPMASKPAYLFSEVSVCVCFTGPMVLYINCARKLLLCWLVLASVYRGLRKCEVPRKFKCSVTSYKPYWGRLAVLFHSSQD